MTFVGQILLNFYFLLFHFHLLVQMFETLLLLVQERINFDNFGPITIYLVAVMAEHVKPQPTFTSIRILPLHFCN